MTLIGVGYRHPLAGWIAAGPAQVKCLEITAEHFYGREESLLRGLARDYPLFVHGLGLSLGTPGPMDEGDLEAFGRVVRLAKPRWISEHISFTRTSEVDLGHLNPIPPTAAMLDVIAGHAVELRERFGAPVLLENITAHLPIQGEMTETDFLNRLCQRADCGLLLDVTNLFINSRNHGFDARAWMRELDPSRIRQLHVVGYAAHDGAYCEDHHGDSIQDDLFELIEDVLAYARVEAVILERDANFPPAAEIEAELERLEAAVGRVAVDHP